MLKIIATHNDRIDKYINETTDISRQEVKDLIEQQQILVNGKVVRKASFTVLENAEIEILQQPTRQDMGHIEPQEIPLDIIFENDDYIVINKPSGLVVHPAPGNMKGTLVNGLLYHFQNNLSDLNGSTRPGIVHRIDKDTSGLLIVAKNNKAHQHFAKLLKDHKIQRRYRAILEGHLENEIIHLDLPIGRDKTNRQKMAVTNINSKPAKTHIFLEKNFNHHNQKLSLVRCELETGRTHQIRVHSSYMNHPVYGDPLYGKKQDDFGQYLHAYELEFIDPKGNRQVFQAPLPKEFNISN
ncbi:RluA family pseudouridine synthase [Candidatus Mycoplasma pogonae]